MNTRIRTLALAVLGAVALLLVGCNTMRGIGEDISAAGSGLANLAKDSSPTASSSTTTPR
jgi:predicted small secreted protein